ncbi:MAG: hypothetical protein KA171_18925 [Reyranella sp.]|nr:hypothetical protein [Reyranella sp.]
MRVDPAERGREMEVVELQSLQVDVEGELKAAARGGAFLLLLLRCAQHADLRGRQELNPQPALQQRCEGPCDARVVDPQPRSRAVRNLDPRHPEIGRHEAVDATDPDLLTG